jgi:WD40 repeat protein
VGGERRLVNDRTVYDFTTGFPAPGQRFAPSAVAALAIHPAGGRLAFGGDDGTLHLWDLTGGRELAHWDAHGQPIRSLAGSPDGKRLASASADGTVKLWSWETGEPGRALDPGVGRVQAVAWSRDGDSLAATGELGVAVWDLAGAAAPRLLSRHSLPAGAVAFGAATLAFGGADGTVEVRDARSGATLHTLRGHTAAVSALDFSPDGSLLAAGAADGTLRVWDAAAGNEVAVFRHQALVATWLAFDPRGRYLAVNTTHATLLCDLRSKAPVAEVVGYAASGRFRPDGSALLLGTDAGAVCGCPTAAIDRARAAAADPGTGPALSGPVLIEPPPAVVPGAHVNATWGVAASPDGRWVATASHDGTVKLWDGRTLRLVRTLEGHNDIVWCVAFSPDSRYLASGSGDVRVWDVATGRERFRFRGHERLVTALAFHPGGPWLASGSHDGSVRLWDLAGGRPLGVLHQFGKGVEGLVFRPDGRRLAAACLDHHVAVWDVSEPPALPAAPDRLLTGHTAGVWAVGFSADGCYLASGSEQGAIILWDGETFDRVVTLRGGTGQVRTVCFSRDGRLLAGAAYTSPTIVWDLIGLRRTLGGMSLDW